MNLVETLYARAALADPQPALRFLETGDVDGPAVVWSFPELHARALRVAAELKTRGLEQVPVLLVYPPCPDFLAAFVGCLYARAIPVPVYPPNPSDLERAIRRILAVAGDCGAPLVLTVEPLRQMASSLGAMLGGLEALEWLATDTLPGVAGPAEVGSAPDVRPDDVAFLQYTSGSTGSPKGVVIRHAELGYHLTAVKRVLPFERHAVTWLPAYHDMGLIGTLLTPLAHSVPITQMSPHAFLMKPSRWMKAIAHYRADMTAGPNFGYHFAVRRSAPEELAALDLSCLKVAVIGAEPISPVMVDELLETFGPLGLEPASIYPAFGMAEATVMVSTNPSDRGPLVQAFDRRALERGEVVPGGEVTTRLVGCGMSIHDGLLIADPDTLRPLPEGRVGEVIVTGPSVAKEYWRRPESKTEVFGCAVQGDDRRWLRTGDLGFLYGGELFICGRLKDLLILRGRNFAAADIELAVEAALGEHHLLRPGRVIAVSVPGEDGEVPVILAELRASRLTASAEEIARDIHRVVAEQYGISVHTVSILPKGAVPLTSSGKVQRRAARASWLDGSLSELERVVLAESAAVEQDLYGSLAYVHNKLDQRGTEYLFDLEHDLPWARIGEPGIYMPATLLSLFGVDPEPLAGSREVYDTLQWAMALSICRTFELLEWGIIQFARRESARLGDTRSIDRLCVEEEKHIQLFRRIANHLVRQRPDLVGPFDAAFAESFDYLRGLFEARQGPELHLKIWLTTLFFEPATLHLGDELVASEEPIQPLWRRAHEVHAQEELQHVATVQTYAAALKIDLETRERVATGFLDDMTRGFRHLYGLAAPLRLVQQRWPDLGWPPSLDPQAPGIPPRFADELLGSAHFKALRRALPELEDRLSEAASTPSVPDPAVIFVLSSERSGSTLLRVMLSAHPGLFSPPEMNLLGYATMGERKAKLPVPQQTGLKVALEALGDTDAVARITAWEAADAPVAEVYAWLQSRLGQRVLVDKSPIYSRDLTAMRRAEDLFGDRARYVFLTRHPYAVIDSYARVGLERLVAERLSGDTDAFGLGEMGWTLSNRTIQAFLADIPAGRQSMVRFEELTQEPRLEAARLCAALRVPYSPRVAQPYRFGEMTGRTGETHAVGDPNFQGHTGIDPALADAWRQVKLPRPLGPEALRVAASLGYLLDPQPIAAAPPAPAVDTRALRAQVVEIVATALRRSPHELDDSTPFAALGLDSLQLVQLTSTLEGRLERTLPAMTLYDHPTIGALLAWLGGKAAAPVAQPQVDLTAEVWLPDAVVGGEIHRQKPDSELLLTGATGFLGAFLLRDLLASTRGPIHCLVRADDAASGMARLRENLARYDITPPADLDARVRAVPGDMALPRLGLGEEAFDALARRVGAVYHNGALLKFGLPYEALAAPNVQGTREVLELATRHGCRPVHYVSSMAVFDTLAHADREVDETSSVAAWQGIRLGYSQTKWVAERLVALAGERGVPVTIYRSAGIGGQRDTGVWNTTDLICRLIKGCAEMGAAPRLTMELDLAPVDYVSSALVWLSLHREPSGATWHLNSPRTLPWQRLLHWMGFAGFEMEELPYEAWVERLMAYARHPEHPLASLVPFFAARLPPDGSSHLQVRQHRPRVHNEVTTSVLREGGIICPPLDNRLLTVWFERLSRDGFLALP